MQAIEKFIAIISNDLLKKSDVIVILEGDGLNRIPHGAKLYKEEWAPIVVLSGGIDNPPHSIPSKIMMKDLIKAGVPEKAVLLEEKSMNTREQGLEIMNLAKERKWKRIILVVSHYHQYRAYLTFLKAMKENQIEIEIINSPARDLLWFDDSDTQGQRVDLLENEFKKIGEYTTKGHLATYEDAIEYQKWKEKQNEN